MGYWSNTERKPPGQTVMRQLRVIRYCCGLVCCLLATAAAPSLGRAEALDEPEITDEDREHWAFRPLVRPPLPASAGREWVRNPIDAFIFEGVSAKQLSPSPPASRPTLIRRVYFDLVGLPPDPAAVRRFVADPRGDAYERLVDRLLESPQYGERWSQHWLDLSRFAETDGFEHDKVRPEAWRYRDWVIEAFNRDLPYDQFVRYQLAGDELAGRGAAAEVATAFCLSGPDMPDINSQEERRHYLLNEMTSTVGAVLLGLQIGCAQCHDHKYDPISQADFYRLRSFFEPAVRVQRDRSVGTLREPAGELPVSHLMIRGDFRRPGPVLRPAFPRIANPAAAAPQIPAGLATSGRRLALADWITDPANPLPARVIVNRIWQYHFGAGLSMTSSDFGYLGDEPIYLELLDWLATELMRRDWSLKQLHRMVITSSTYRQSSHPSGSPDAATSASWQANLEGDPSNIYWSRFSQRRLSGEGVRDAMLAAAGALSSVRGGPGVRPPLPDELVNTLLKNQWTESPEPESHYRRSIYVFARRNLRYPVFEAFDRPDGNASCPQRSQSTTAPQSLLLLNSEFSLRLAQRFAGRLSQPTLGDQIAYAVQVAFGRQPSGPEQRLLERFVNAQRAALSGEGRPADQLALPHHWPKTADPYSGAALTDLCLALFNANEFLYID